MLGIGVVAGVIFGIATLVTGVLSDRFGRRPVIMASCVVGIVWALALFPRLDTGSAIAFAAGQTITLVVLAVSYGPAGSFLPELFAAQHRYTGAGLGYNIAGVLGGAIPPLLAPALAASFGSIAIGVMLSFCGVLSLACTCALSETRGRAMAHE